MKTRHIDLLWAGLIILLVLMFNSCKVSRDVSKQVAKSDQTVTTNHELTTVTQDNTVTRTTERTQDTITTPPVNVSASGIGQSVSTVTEDGTLNATYDPVKKTIEASFKGGGKKIPVSKEVITEVKADVKTATTASSDSTGTTKTLTKSKDVETTTSWQWWWFVVGAIAMVVLYVGYRKLKDWWIIRKFCIEEKRKVINKATDPP